jgi:uncharacterized protein (UPF0212 family)
MNDEKTLFGKPASETIRMLHQVILAAFLSWLTLSIKDVNAEMHTHATSIATIQSTQGQVIVRIDGDIQEIREALNRIENELLEIRETEAGKRGK